MCSIFHDIYIIQIPNINQMHTILKIFINCLIAF